MLAYFLSPSQMDIILKIFNFKRELPIFFVVFIQNPSIKSILWEMFNIFSVDVDCVYPEAAI